MHALPSSQKMARHWAHRFQQDIKQVHLLDTVPHYVTLYFLQHTSPQMCILFLWHSDPIPGNGHLHIRFHDYTCCKVGGWHLLKFTKNAWFLANFKRVQPRTLQEISSLVSRSTNLRLASVEHTALPGQWGRQTIIVHTFFFLNDDSISGHVEKLWLSFFFN
jgi:hypothetical protein